ncbi:MAG: carboxymuconolactone decarboxylase family protein [Candidatus Entotheonellia bacterium]
MARVPPASKESLPQNLREAFDAMVQSRGGVPRTGPASAMINSPEACRRAFHFSDYLRRESTLVPHVQELAMLVTARELDCQYVWNAHAASGKKAGLSAELVEALRDEKPLPSLKPEEAAVITYGREFFRTHRVSRGAFQAAQEQFGVQGLAELTMLMGFYGMLAFHVNAFDADLPAERTEPLLPV